MSVLEHLRPLRDGIVIRRIEIPPAGLIVLPEIAQKAARRGEVIAHGPGKRDAKGRLQPIGVKVGDVVSYQSHDRDDGDYVLIREGDILGVEALV